jgi:transketolase
MTRAMRDAWAETLRDLAVENRDLLILDGDLATSTRADRFAAAHPDRFLQMGIAEQNMVGVAAGLATMGYVPWLSSFAVFLTHRAVDQVRMLVAQTHANVKIGAAYTGLLTGFTGKTHQDVEDLAIMRAMPGMTVIAPADATECVAAVRWATETPGPVYVRLARDAGPDIFDDTYRFAPGRVIRLRVGSDVLIVSTGPQSARCLAAATILEAAGISAGVLHVPCLKPVDAAAIAEAASDVRLVVTAEEHTILGGLGGLVAEILGERAPRRLVRIGIVDTWGESAPNAFLLDRHGLSPERVAERVAHELSGSTQRSGPALDERPMTDATEVMG